MSSSTVKSQPLNRLIPQYRFQQQQQQQQQQQYPFNTYQQSRPTQQQFEQLQGKNRQQQQQQQQSNIINKRQDLGEIDGGLWGKRDNSYDGTWNSKNGNNITRQQQQQQQQRFSNYNNGAVNEKEIVISKLVKLRADVDDILAQHFNVITEKRTTNKRQLLESAGLWG